MPRSKVKVEKEEKPETSEEQEMENIEDQEEEEDGDDDEWEETTMVVTVNGILDADLVREAIAKDLVKLRYAETENPVLQLNNSLYTATWTKDLGTNIVLQTSEKEQLKVIACGSTMMQAEKALLTSMKTKENPFATNTDAVPQSSLSRSNTKAK